ncbi:transposase [Bradyrhizobium diazoefficiens]|nr:transposase [Bradyrhizobium diazoefficiens]MBR1007909.1 transposase [Bradyrhizobium diazoefficiens]MBR1013474.1 transposase [Bradyrhizobium diazoefficiens]MBR1050566.1 transposase [Bradyrhizobium diazoefficiens]MBR1057453.1 transposase [Bradyrhizobium diazoefficiens]
MAKQVYWLSDAEWRRIEPLLPRGRKGAHRVDDRRVISGIMHMLKSGSRWRDCPEVYGPYTTVYSLDQRQRDVRLVVEDVVSALGLPTGDQFAAHDDAALGKADLLADLQYFVPPGFA